MKYTELKQMQESMSNMVLNTLIFEKKNKCYGLLDFAELTFKNLAKHRAKEHNIPQTPNGDLDAIKFFNTKKEEFKKTIEKEGKVTEKEGVTLEEAIEAEASKQANDFSVAVWTKFLEEDQNELLEPINPKYLHFLSESQFASLTAPRKISTFDKEGNPIKTDWFITADQERLLAKYLLEEDKPKKKA